MGIDVSEFVKVDIAISPTGLSSGNFGILGFLTNEEGVITPAERARAYTSLASVGDDWATTTEVYKAATAFYGQTPTPTDFTAHMCFETGQVASLISANAVTVEELIAGVTGAGVFDITIDAVNVSIVDLDFTALATNDEAGVALELETAIVAGGATGATVVWNGYSYVVNGVILGSASGIISYATGDAAELLGLTVATAKISQGIDAETPLAALNELESLGIETVGLVTHKKYRDVVYAGGDGTSTRDIAEWAEASNRIFCNTSNDLGCLSSVITTDIASVMQSLTLKNTLTTFSKDANAYPSASVFGRAASVNFSGIGTTITLNLKQMPGIVAEDLTPNELAVLRSKYCSVIVVIAGQINAYTDSRMASGTWLDTIHGVMWLQNRIETDIFNLLYTTNTKIPYTEVGIEALVTVLTGSLQQAVNNGLAAPGYLADGTYLSAGFAITRVPLEEVPPADTGNRIYKGLGFTIKGAGALHEVEVNGQFTE